MTICCKEIALADGSKTQFEYDANGLRTQKRQYDENGDLQYYVDYIWEDGKLQAQYVTLMVYVTYKGVTTAHEFGPFTSKVIYDDSGVPQGFMLNDASQFAFVRNLQGDVIAVVDKNGETVMEYSYDPWGNIEYHLSETFGTEEDAMLFTALCPLTYRGYNYDFTTGLYYLQSRYYNPEWGRFINCDDTNILLATQGETHNANLFAYCANNPINKTDYDGKCPLNIPNKTVSVNIYGENDHADMQIGPILFGYGAYENIGTIGDSFKSIGSIFQTAGGIYEGVGGWTFGIIGTGSKWVGSALNVVEESKNDVLGTQGIFIVAYNVDAYYENDYYNKGKRERISYSISVTDEEFINLLIFYISYMLSSSDYKNKKYDSVKRKADFTEGADYDWTWCYLIDCDYATYYIWRRNCATLVADALEFAMPERYEKAKPFSPIIMPRQLVSLINNL